MSGIWVRTQQAGHTERNTPGEHSNADTSMTQDLYKEMIRGPKLEAANEINFIVSKVKSKLRKQNLA